MKSAPFHHTLKAMNKRQESSLKKMGIFTLSQAKEIGLSQQELSRLVAAKKLKRVARGIFLHPEADLESDVGFQIACAKLGPKAVIGGLSALFHYNLIEQVPSYIWVIVPPEKKTRNSEYKLIRTKVNLDKGVIAENGYRIVTLERAILEGLKLITKVGQRTAVKAARDALLKRQTTLSKLGKASKELGLESVLTKYQEVIIL